MQTDKYIYNFIHRRAVEKQAYKTRVEEGESNIAKLQYKLVAMVVDRSLYKNRCERTGLYGVLSYLFMFDKPYLLPLRVSALLAFIAPR
jgi:hypothetical protein